MSFKPVVFDDVADAVPENPSWLVNRLVVQGSLGVLAGDPKAGKSELSYQMVTAVATGQPFLGFETRQVSVLLVVAEESRETAVQRLKHFGLPRERRVNLWTEGVMDSATNRGDIGRFLQENPAVRFIVIDTLASYLLLQDENDNSHLTNRIKPYMDLAHSTGITILFIHHRKKNREEAGSDTVRDVRGASAIAGLVDTIYQLKPIHGGPSTRRRLKIDRRGREGVSDLTLDWPTYPDGEYICL